MSLIIGMHGKARTGKDSSAIILRAQGWMHISFAQPIREFMCKLLSVDLQELERIKEIPHPLLKGKTPRYAMQTLGTEWGREMISMSLWTDVCLTKAAAWAKSGHNVVISDVRFTNEAEGIRAMGGKIWKMERPNAPKPDNEGHVSEKDLPADLIDLVVDNSGTLGDLEAKIKALI